MKTSGDEMIALVYGSIVISYIKFGYDVIIKNFSLKKVLTGSVLYCIANITIWAMFGRSGVVATSRFYSFVRKVEGHVWGDGQNGLESKVRSYWEFVNIECYDISEFIVYCVVPIIFLFVLYFNLESIRSYIKENLNFIKLH